MILIIIGLIRHIRVIMHVSHCAGNKNEVIYLHTHMSPTCEPTSWAIVAPYLVQM